MTEETLDLTTDEALLESLAEHKVEELKLEPFSLMRQVIAADLCDMGSGPFWHALMTIWVCTLNQDQALNAHTDMNKAKKDAFEWGEKRGYNYDNWKPLLDIYIKLQREWRVVAKARIALPNGQEPELSPNAGGQPT